MTLDYKIQYWDSEDLQIYLDLMKVEGNTERDGALEVVKDFHYFGRDFDDNIRQFQAQDTVYASEKDLKPFEIQSDRTLPNSAYNKAVVAIDGYEIHGIMMMSWLKNNSIWHYHCQFIDVNKKSRNRGVATTIINSLDDAPFLRDKVLEVGSFSYLGSKFIEKVLRRVKVENFKLLYKDSPLVFLDMPSKNGNYLNLEKSLFP